MNEERTFKCLPKDTAPAPGAGGDWDPRTQGALRPAPPPCLAPAQFYFYCLSLLDLWPSQQHSPRCQAPWQRPLPGEGDSAQPCQHASGRTLHGQPTGDTQEPHPWTVSSVGHSYPERKNERHRPHRQQVQEAPGALPSPGLTPRAAGCSWSAGMDARAEQHVVSPLCLFSSTFCHSASVWHLPIVVQLCAEVDACSSASCLLVWTHAGELWGVGLLKGTAMGAGGHVPGVWLVLPSLPFTNS